MAKVFRKIRQKFLQESNFKKYLIYAAGEVILVVIGILIALQINTSNQNQKRAKLEKTLLRQIKFELLEIHEDVWRDVAMLNLGRTSHHLIDDYIQFDRPYSDSLCFYFHWLKKDEYVFPTSAAYSRLKGVGIDIIQNDSLGIIIQSLYEGLFPRLTKVNAEDISGVFDDYYVNNFQPNDNMDLRFDHFLTPDTIGKRIYTDISYQFPKPASITGKRQTIGYVPLDFEQIKKDPKFLMLMERTRYIRDVKLIHYGAVREFIEKAVLGIEKELD